MRRLFRLIKYTIFVLPKQLFFLILFILAFAIFGPVVPLLPGALQELSDGALATIEGWNASSSSE